MMDYIDEMQLDRQKTPIRSQDVSIEQAINNSRNTRTFEENKTTKKQVKEEMKYTIENCTRCIRRKA